MFALTNCQCYIRQVGFQWVVAIFVKKNQAVLIIKQTHKHFE